MLSFAVTGFSGYHPTDDGLIYAWSWRIFNGEIPYRDFIYIRTPLTLYLHTAWLWLPDGWQLQTGRLVYYLEMVGVVAFPLVWAVRTGRLRTDVRSIGLVTIGLAFALNNFLPMPWYTVDGLLFGSAALMALLYSRTSGPSRSALWWRAAASAAAVLAALCKQNFSVLPLFLGAFALVEFAGSRAPRRWPLLLASVLPGAAIVAGSIAWLAAVGALAHATSQLTTTVPPGEPLFSAVTVYVRFPVIVAIAVLVPAGFVLTWSGHTRPPAHGAYALVRRIAVPVVLLGLVLVELALLALEATGWGTYRLGHPVFWGLVGIAGALTVLRCRRAIGDAETPMLHWGILALAWAASISGGYASPILGLAPMGLLLAQALPPERIRWERPLVGASAAVVLALHLILTLQYPYRERPRVEQTANLGDLYPRFGRLLTNQANYDRFAELKRMTNELAIARGRTYAVIPTFALIHFLSGTRNPVSVNTYSSIEYRGFEDQLAREFEERRPIIFIERDPTVPVGAREERQPTIRIERDAAAPGKARAELRVRCSEWLQAGESGIVGQAVETWRLAAEGTAFCAYEHR